MANQVKVGDKVFIPGSGWALIVQITSRTNWKYILPGGGVPIAGSGDILNQPEKYIRDTGAMLILDTYNSGH